MNPTIVEGWVNNLGVRLHYIDSSPDASTALCPLVYIHGAYGTAEGFLPEMQTLSPRRCVAVSLRGRGKSDAPEAGYSFAHHISDIEALVGHLGLARFCLMGWSVGVAYSVGYASQHSETLGGLILLDYPARHPAFKPDWAVRGLSDPSYDWKPHAVRAIQQESTEVPLWDDLHKIRCPVLVIGGGQSEALLRPEHVEKYNRFGGLATLSSATREAWVSPIAILNRRLCLERIRGPSMLFYPRKQIGSLLSFAVSRSM